MTPDSENRHPHLYSPPMIVAHLDLDAFFAAVEELENPALRTVPLIVGGDPHGRGVVATANYVARSFGIHSAMSAPRRCAAARTRCSSGRATRCTATTRARSGRPSGRSSRRSSRRGSTRATSTSASVAAALRRRARRRRGRSRGRPRAHASVVLARRRDVEGRREGRLRPAQAGRAHRRAARARGGVSRAVPDPAAAGRRPEGGGAAHGLRHRDDRAARRDRRRRARAACCAARSDGSCATARAASTRGRSSCPSSGSRSRRRRRSRATSPIPSGSTTSSGGWPVKLAGYLEARGQVARTVTTKVRYPDFAIRTRSTSLPVGTDDADRIGELACGLLDRALRDRPAPLRLVGVGVSGSTSMSNFRSRRSSELLPRSRRKFTLSV